jgi:hypothetical protein
MRRAVIAAVVSVALLGIVFGACEDVSEEASPTETVTQTPSQALRTGAEITNLTPVVGDLEAAIEKAKEATALDNAKPRFRGELGDFVIVESVAPHYPCPEPYQPASNIERSELYFSLPGAGISTDMVGSCQGTVIGITADVGDGYSMVGRAYFLGPKVELSIDAPADRLKLMTVGAKPALAELGVPGGLLTTTQVVVIERFPSETAPGIITWAQSIDDVNRAIRLAEAIMGQAPSP